MARLALFLSLAAVTANAVWQKFDLNHFLLQDLGLQSTAATPVDEWFEQKLDHNDASNTKTWKHRYHVNPAWFGGKDSPVFVYINGENVASPATTTSPNLFMNELAQKYKALVVSVEHRFYGKSQPTGDLSTESMLKYLTAEQALKDLVAVQGHIIRQRNLTASNKWVTFGGSYPGMLSGYAKYKFPNNFVGSVASSAPIWTKTDFFEYSEVVAYGLKYYGGDECLRNVGKALEDFHGLMISSKPEDAALFKKVFNPCAPIQNDFDRMTLEVGMFGNFQGSAQYNGFFGPSLKRVCDFFAVKNETSLERLAAFNAKISWDDRKCTAVDFNTEWIAPLNNPALDTENIMRQWIFQTCAEFGFGQTTKLSKSIFGVLKYGDVEKVYYEVCKRLFGITDTEKRTEATRKTYGSLKIDVANVVWPSGTIDPWSALALSNTTRPVNPNSDVVDIEGTSHCADMYSRAKKLVPAWALDRIEANVDSYLRQKC